MITPEKIAELEERLKRYIAQWDDTPYRGSPMTLYLGPPSIADLRALLILAQQAQEQSARIAELEGALENLEMANDDLCAKRSEATYDSMVLGDGCKEELGVLDDARRRAAIALNPPAESAEAKELFDRIEHFLCGIDDGEADDLLTQLSAIRARTTEDKA